MITVETAAASEDLSLESLEATKVLILEVEALVSASLTLDFTSTSVTEVSISTFITQIYSFLVVIGQDIEDTSIIRLSSALLELKITTELAQTVESKVTFIVYILQVFLTFIELQIELIVDGPITLPPIEESTPPEGSEPPPPTDVSEPPPPPPTDGSQPPPPPPSESPEPLPPTDGSEPPIMMTTRGPPPIHLMTTKRPRPPGPGIQHISCIKYLSYRPSSIKVQHFILERLILVYCKQTMKNF